MYICDESLCGCAAENRNQRAVPVCACKYALNRFYLIKIVFKIICMPI